MWTVEYFDDLVVVVGEPTRTGPAEVDLPLEFFNRELRDIDLDDSAALAALVATYGPITPLADDGAGRLALLPYAPPDLEQLEQLLDIATVVTNHGDEAATRSAILDLVVPPTVPRQRSSIVSAFSDQVDYVLDIQGRLGRHPAAAQTVSTATIRYHIRVLRAMSKMWVAHVADERTTALQEAWTSEGFRDPTVGGTTSGEYNVWNWWQEHLNAALAPFHPRVIVEGAPGFFRAPLFSLAALQLWNSVVEEDDYRRCHNESCRRWFSHQRGGAMTGQYRDVGVRFCTPGCARAQSVREYRRRVREGKTKKGEA